MEGSLPEGNPFKWKRKIQKELMSSIVLAPSSYIKALLKAEVLILFDVGGDFVSS